MKQYIVDAFTDQIFHGNQAAICIMEQWVTEDLISLKQLLLLKKEINIICVGLHQVVKLISADMQRLHVPMFCSDFISKMRKRSYFQHLVAI